MRVPTLNSQLQNGTIAHVVSSLRVNLIKMYFSAIQMHTYSQCLLPWWSTVSPHRFTVYIRVFRCAVATATADLYTEPYQRIIIQQNQQTDYSQTHSSATEHNNTKCTFYIYTRFVNECGNQLKVIKTSPTIPLFYVGIYTIYIFTVNWTRMTENTNNRMRIRRLRRRRILSKEFYRRFRRCETRIDRGRGR